MMRRTAFIPQAAPTAAGLLLQLAAGGPGGIETSLFQRPADAALPPDAEERWELLEAITDRICDPEGAGVRLDLLRHLATAPAVLT